MNLNEVTKGILCNSTPFDLKTAPVPNPGRTFAVVNVRERVRYVAVVLNSQ